jgi:hypothetical protein
MTASPAFADLIDPVAEPDGFVVVSTDGFTQERTVEETAFYDDSEDARTHAATAQDVADEAGRNVWFAPAAVYLMGGKR